MAAQKQTAALTKSMSALVSSSLYGVFFPSLPSQSGPVLGGDEDDGANAGSPAQEQERAQQQQHQAQQQQEQEQQQQLVVLLLLAVQFGLQPTLNKTCVAKTVPTTGLVIATELVKLGFSLVLLVLSTTPAERAAVAANVSPRLSMLRAGVPALLYSIQNMLILFGSSRLPALTLALLNQTKTLSAAFFVWVILDKPQTPAQIVALGGLACGAAMVVTAEQQQSPSSQTQPKAHTSGAEFWWGFIAVAVASLLSGFCSAITERTLSSKASAGYAQTFPPHCNSLVFSIELAVCSALILVGSMVLGLNQDRDVFFSDPLRGWTVLTLLPVVSQASGGILVGIVTQRAGGVKKGFALILGICFAAFVESVIGSKRLTQMHVLSVALVCLSMWLYFVKPYNRSVPQPGRSDDADQAKKQN